MKETMTNPTPQQLERLKELSAQALRLDPNVPVLTVLLTVWREAQEEKDSANSCPEDCRMCSGEVCSLCGAGSWSNEKNCQHDVIDRHKESSIQKIQQLESSLRLAVSLLGEIRK